MWELLPIHWSQMTCFLQAEKCFVSGYVTLFKMDEQNFHLLITAAIIWVKDNQAKWSLWKHLNATCEHCVSSRHAEKTCCSEGDGNKLGAQTMLIIMQYATNNNAHNAQHCGYGGWFTPTTCNIRCTLIGLRSYHIHTTSEPHESSCVIGPWPPLQRGLHVVVLIWVWSLYSHHQKQWIVLTQKLH